ncbi:uncharacterized protein LOC141856766 [Brevipalpus obovatus]|uniref:uncharacterized protein LOC141856766 n=1 Tax=Brevipalpus obovatus TaxID=246614 RepID=UPI003D9DE69C
MTTALKSIVSKKKKRFQRDGFNLDLSYILPNLIAMGYPADKVERIYRNSIDDVKKFLENKHKDHYKIYNLCSERNYDPSKFHYRVALYPIDDHNPPTFNRIKEFCEDVENWLQQNDKNIAAIHCKAGKGRTGAMLCSYLVHSGHCQTAGEALQLYASQRTKDNRGVTIPSQRRYVHYYERLVRSKREYQLTDMFLRSILLQRLPNRTKGGFTLMISQDKQCIHTEYLKCAKGEDHIYLSFESLQLSGDMKVELYTSNNPSKPTDRIIKKDRLFALCLNTFFIKLEYSDPVNVITCSNGVKSTKAPNNTIPSPSPPTSNTNTTFPSSSPSRNSNIVNHTNTLDVLNTITTSCTVEASNCNNHSNSPTNLAVTSPFGKSPASSINDGLMATRSPTIKHLYNIEDDFCDHIENSTLSDTSGEMKENSTISNSSIASRGPLYTSYVSNMSTNSSNNRKMNGFSFRTSAVSISPKNNNSNKSPFKSNSAKFSNYKTKLPSLVRVNGRSSTEQSSASSLCSSSHLSDPRGTFLSSSNQTSSLFQERRFNFSDTLEDGDHPLHFYKEDLDKVGNLDDSFKVTLTFRETK